jgi:hypothetical protein
MIKNKHLFFVLEIKDTNILFIPTKRPYMMKHIHRISMYQISVA